MDKKDEFLEKLKALFSEYNAELECDDEFSGFPECGEDLHMRVFIVGEEGNIDLGQYFRPDKMRGEETK